MSPDLLAKPMERESWLSPRFAGMGILSLVFLCGVAAGAVGMDLGFHTFLHQRPFWERNPKAEYLKTVKKELDLTPQQTAEMESILNDFAKYYQTVLSDGKARILSILNDEQKRKFEKMLKERPRN
jgi:hypothetical protein